MHFKIVQVVKSLIYEICLMACCGSEENFLYTYILQLSSCNDFIYIKFMMIFKIYF